MGTITIKASGNPFSDLVLYPDGTQVPRKFTASGRPTGADGEIELDIEVDGAGKPRCVGMELRADPGSDGISSTTLRAISVPEMVREAVAVARGMMGKRVTTDGKTRITPVGVPSEDYPEFVEQVRAPHRGSPITPANLNLIAQWYEAAQADHLKPAVVISQKAGVSLATAYRWLKAANESGAIKDSKAEGE